VTSAGSHAGDARRTLYCTHTVVMAPTKYGASCESFCFAGRDVNWQRRLSKLFPLLQRALLFLCRDRAFNSHTWSSALADLLHPCARTNVCEFCVALPLTSRFRRQVITAEHMTVHAGVQVPSLLDPILVSAQHLHGRTSSSKPFTVTLDDIIEYTSQSLTALDAHR
jgi:hypothetical protein